jgi:hypothetical protein
MSFSKTIGGTFGVAANASTTTLGGTFDVQTRSIVTVTLGGQFYVLETPEPLTLVGTFDVQSRPGGVRTVQYRVLRRRHERT